MNTKIEIKKISAFSQPQRRLVRQKSGFKVNGNKAGSECQIFNTRRYQISDKEIRILYGEKNIKLPELFAEKLAIYGVGLYIKSDKDLIVHGDLRVVTKGKRKFIGEHYEKNISSDMWTRIGFDLTIGVDSPDDIYNTDVALTFLFKEKKAKIEVFGFQSGGVGYFIDKQNYKTSFYEKTDLYKPEIYYLPFKDLIIKKAVHLGNGYIIGKSCNRCGRFLPIDVDSIESELNPLGFSNHCKKRSPCSHNAFSRYYIENDLDIPNLPKNLKDRIITVSGKQYFKVYYGFQLECRSCKKFEVNAPLNPLRNKAQHHEDGARRRAVERMIIELTGNDVIKNFRVKNKQEFQEYIWEKFNRKCFACNKPLVKSSDMDIDHTLPLVYLWPLNETATCLCKTCNSLKHDLFPGEFALYSSDKLKQLSKLTGVPLRVITSKKRIANYRVVKILVDNITWLFDDFLSRKDYQKVKEGKTAADLIYKALQKVLVKEGIDLVSLYYKKTGRYPSSITIS